MAKCKNYQNQKAIDTLLEKSNESLMVQDRASGIRNPEPLYTLGKNVCNECYHQNGMTYGAADNDLRDMEGII